MTLVYVVTQGSYSDYHIEAMFSTMEKAMAYIDEYNARRKATDCDYDLMDYEQDIEEWDLDKPVVHFDTIEVRMRRNGDVFGAYVYQEGESREPGFVKYSKTYQEETLLEWRVKTDDGDEAVKVVGEKRQKIIANHTWGDTDKTIALFRSG